MTGKDNVITQLSLATMNLNESVDPNNPMPGPSGLQRPVQGSGECSESEDRGNTSSSKQISIQRCIQSLVHATQCHDTDCQLASCRKMKRIVTHSKSCKRKVNCSCSICKQLIALCCHHIKVCNEPRCQVPFCLNIKQKIRQQQLDEPMDPRPGPSGLQTPVQGSGEGSVTEDRGNTSSTRKISIQRCIQSLVHATQCHDTDCQLPSCRKMKRIVTHTKSSKCKVNGGCSICKQLITLCCHHARVCNEPRCRIPFCLNIKQKMRQQQVQQWLQEAMMNMNMEEQDDDDDDICIICQDREKVAVVVPCGHSDYCLQCVLEWHKNGDPEKEQTCPMCRQPIEQVIPFSFSKFLN